MAHLALLEALVLLVRFPCSLEWCLAACSLHLAQARAIEGAHLSSQNSVGDRFSVQSVRRQSIFAPLPSVLA